MNKFGFISIILTFLLFFLQFIPLGFFFQFENPYVNFKVKVPIQLFTYEDTQIFIWGIKTSGTFHLWFDVNFLSGIFLIFLTPLAGLLTIVGFCKENRVGKRLMNFSFVLMLAVLLYSIIGIPIYSEEILGFQFGYFDIFYYLNFGFYILIINTILIGIGYKFHPME
ncbi:MAG: hypothetical protein ACXABO_04170 [Promethearchaeota archaeon]|jgi:hypothetical protein